MRGGNWIWVLVLGLVLALSVGFGMGNGMDKGMHTMGSTGSLVFVFGIEHGAGGFCSPFFLHRDARAGMDCNYYRLDYDRKTYQEEAFMGTGMGSDVYEKL